MATNPYAGTDHELAWEDGFGYGRDHSSETDPTPPVPFDDASSHIWLEGATAGREEGAAYSGPPDPPPAPPAEPAPPPAAAPHNDDGVPLNPTHAAPSQVPASFHAGGLPAFRYNLPTAPLGTLELETGVASVKIEFGMRGNVTVSFTDPAKWASLDQSGLRAEAAKAIGGLTEGLRISGLPNNPSLGVTIGTTFDTTETRFTPPSTITFIGQSKVDYTVPSPGGDVKVQGQPGFELKVTVIPHVPADPEPATVEEFHTSESHGGVLLAIGAVVLVVLALAAAPETGGGSLVALGAL